MAASFEVLSFDIGRTNEDFSHLKLKVTAPDAGALERLVQELMPLGCHPVRERDVDFASPTRMAVRPKVSIRRRTSRPPSGTRASGSTSIDSAWTP